MAISTLSKINMALTFIQGGQTCMNVWSYNVLEIIGTPTAGDYAEAWWNHVKTNYRALASAYFGTTFIKVVCSELGNPTTGEYGEYAIPSGEAAGSRSYSSGEAMPPFVSVGMRLAVLTRTTRPGQKRLGWVMEGDVNGSDVQSGYLGLADTLGATMLANMTLGAPAAGVVLVPHVVSLNTDGSIRAAQLASGYSLNTKATSQVSRKWGRGI